MPLKRVLRLIEFDPQAMVAGTVDVKSFFLSTPPYKHPYQTPIFKSAISKMVVTACSSESGRALIPASVL